MTKTIVSVIMANYNAAEYITAALKSVLGQSVSQIEILLADDASTDSSVSVARDIAKTDARLKIIEASANAGPAAARNRALDAATGDWIAIVDSDDIVHPERFEKMLATAQDLGADAVADDLTYFVDGTVQPGATLLGNTRPKAAQELSPSSFVSSTRQAPKLGYLKPLIRRAAIGDLRYREDIRIGEDHDFYMRFLLNGGRMHLLPQSYYLYRRHAHSLSHRLHPDDVRAMIAAQDDLMENYPGLPADLRAEFELRRMALHEPLAFETLVQNIKSGRYKMAFRDVVRKPALLASLGSIAKARVTRRFKTPTDRSGPRQDPSQWTAQDWSANLAPRSS